VLVEAGLDAGTIDAALREALATRPEEH
jgi:hypothetical protein